MAGLPTLWNVKCPIFGGNRKKRLKMEQFSFLFCTFSTKKANFPEMAFGMLCWQP